MEFELSVRQQSGGATQLKLECDGAEWEYTLPDNSHQAFSDLHQFMADHCGTRPPAQGKAEGVHAFPADYTKVLDHNISSEILYGYGDPCVIRVPDASSRSGYYYYLTATSNDAPDSFPILRSADLKDWELQSFAFPAGRKPEWTKDGLNVSDFWAPEIHQVGQNFLMCFTAREKDGTLAIGLARAGHPAGPYTAMPRPVLTGGVIDAHIFVEQDGTPYLFWKEDNNDIWPSRLVNLLKDQPQLASKLFDREQDRKTAALMTAASSWIKTLEPMERFQMLQPLIEAVTEDFFAFKKRLSACAQTAPELQPEIGEVLNAMRTPFNMQQLDPEKLSLIGERRTVIENDQAWEGHLIEGMYLVRLDKYYLFYSGNDFTTDKYGIGVAVADELSGPYKKEGVPLLQSTVDWSGPGHPSVVRGLDDKPLLVMHGFLPRTGGYKVFRALLTAPLSFRNGQVKLDCMKEPYARASSPTIRPS